MIEIDERWHGMGEDLTITGSDKIVPGSESEDAEFSDRGLARRVLTEAIGAGVSDIYIEDGFDFAKLSYGLNGELVERDRLPRSVGFPAMNEMIRFFGRGHFEERKFWDNRGFLQKILGKKRATEQVLVPDDLEVGEMANANLWIYKGEVPEEVDQDAIIVSSGVEEAQRRARERHDIIDANTFMVGLNLSRFPGHRNYQIELFDSRRINGEADKDLDLFASSKGLVLLTGLHNSGRTTTAYNLFSRARSLGGNGRAAIVERKGGYPISCGTMPRFTASPEVLGVGMYKLGLGSIELYDPGVLLVDDVSDADTADMVFEQARRALVIATIYGENRDDGREKIEGLLRGKSIANVLKTSSHQQFSGEGCSRNIKYDFVKG